MLKDSLSLELITKIQDKDLLNNPSLLHAVAIGITNNAYNRGLKIFYHYLKLALKANHPEAVKLLSPYVSMSINQLNFITTDETYGEDAIKALFEDPNVKSMVEEHIKVNLQSNYKGLLLASKEDSLVNTLVKYTQGLNESEELVCLLEKIGINNIAKLNSIELVKILLEGVNGTKDLKQELGKMDLIEVAKLGFAELINIALGLSEEQIPISLMKAITNQDVNTVKILLEHPSILINQENLYTSVITENKELIELLVKHPSAKIDYWSFIETILRVKNPEIINLICSHPSAQELVREYHHKNERNPDKIAKILPYIQEVHEDIDILGNDYHS